MVTHQSQFEAIALIKETFLRFNNGKNRGFIW
jgi:hypothetical protein